MSRSIAEFVRQPKTLLLAHRGNSAAAPENTLPAFAAAVEQGVDLVELDYRHSADGVPVVFHDETLDRSTDAAACWGGQDILLASRPWAELGQLDAGRWFSPEFAGTRLPTLEQALSLICRESRCMIERKAGDAATCIKLLRRLDVTDRVVVTAFDWAFLAECRDLAPELTLGALGDEPLTSESLDRAVASGASIVGWGDTWISREQIALAHGRGLRVWVWTVDDPGRARQLVAFGVDGLITNVPAMVLNAT